ncbi:MAG: DNA methyltransferase [Candidatus Kerfeldbacteria bacterium]|nr:DNA methyltransferase [Candidatus Kerfeldbacteria bacterium]
MDQHIQTTMVAIGDLNPAAYNPRKWPDSAIANLRESIKLYGLVDPLLVNSSPTRKNIVIGGHFRLKVAKELGYTHVPVIYLELDEAKEKELNLRLNANHGEWDYDLLKEFDIELLLDVGFDDSDLSAIWDDTIGVEDDGFDTEKELPKAQDTQIKEGEIYQLGKHRLICGDSTDTNVIERLLDGAKVNMIYSDPPYNIGLSYSKGVSTKGKYGNTKVNDHKTLFDYGMFLQKTMEAALNVSYDSTHVFYWCDEQYIGLIQQLYRTLGVNNKRVCLWIKNNHNMTPQIAFNKLYEPCVYGTRGTPYLAPINNLNEVLNAEVGTGNRAVDDIQDIINIWLEKRLPGHEYTHPTEKPPTLHEKPLRRCTKPGDRVLDSFGGSGSSLAACEQLNRICYLSELSPVFCQLIINRYEQLTGIKAKRIG